MQHHHSHKKPVSDAEQTAIDYTLEHKKRPRRVTLLMAMVLVVALMAGFILLQQLQHQREIEKQSTESSKKKPADDSKKSPKMTAEDTLKRIERVFGSVQDLMHAGYVAPYSLKDSLYATGVGAKTQSIGDYFDKEYKKPFQNARNALVDMGYTEQSSEAGMLTNEVAASTFATDDVVCRLSSIEPTTDEGRYSVMLSCVDVSVIKDIYNAQQQFYEVYTARDGGTAATSAELALIGYPKITQGEFVGYTLAEVSVGSKQSLNGSIARFYQTPDGVWHYFTSSKEIVACSKYDSAELKHAYVNTKCYDEKTNKESLVIIGYD